MLVTVSGTVCVHSRQAAKISVGALAGEDQRAAVQLVDREELELERGDDADRVRVAAAQRPEELGLVVAVDADRGGASAVTSSIAVTLLQARPCARPSQLRPPPSM